MIGSSFIKKWNLVSSLYQVLPLGISGLFSKDLLTKKHLDRIMPFDNPAQWIFFYCGSNDIDKHGEDPDIVIHWNIQFLQFLSGQSSANILVFSLLKSPRILANTKKTAAIDKINRHMRDYCLSDPRLYYMDFNRSVRKDEYYQDDYHLNALGYHQIEKNVKKKIDI